MKIGNVVQIGCGGTGSWLAEPLARMLAFNPAAKGASLTLVDGDMYEPKNAERQACGSGLAAPQAKAQATHVRLRLALGHPATNVVAAPVAQYVGGRDIASLVVNRRTTPDAPVVVIFAVDNSATVKQGLDALDALKPTDPWLAIVPGNGLDQGMVSVYGKMAGAQIGRDPRLLYDNYRNPEDRVPGGGCSALAPSTPQLLVANMGAAFGVLSALQNWLDGQQVAWGWSFNIRQGRAWTTGTFACPTPGMLDAALAVAITGYPTA